MPKKSKTRGYGWTHTKGHYRKFNNNSVIITSSEPNTLHEHPALQNEGTEEAEEMPPIEKLLCSVCGFWFTEAKCLRNHFQLSQPKNPGEIFGANTDMVKLEIGEPVLEKLDLDVTEPKLVIKTEELEITETTIFSTIPLTGESTWQSIPRSYHMDEYNGTVTPYRCNTCGFSTTESIFLNAHKKLKHRRKYIRMPRGKILKCMVCDYAFDSRYARTVHMRQHTGERPFKCAICNYASTQRGNLVLHIRTHTGQKPFRCTVCDYASTQSSSLKVHMRKHTGDKPFKCATCSYASTQRGSLIMHIRTHTGQKPFQCTVCNYVSAQSSSLKLHMKKHT